MKARKFGRAIGNHSTTLWGLAMGATGAYLNYDGGGLAPFLLFLTGMVLTLNSLDRNVYFKRYKNLAAIIQNSGFELKRVDYVDYEIVDEEE